MSVIELRKKIMKRVSSIENEEILKEIYDIIEAEADLEPVYKLTDEERNAIEIGLKDLREGRVVSSTKANELIQEWLKKLSGPKPQSHSESLVEDAETWLLGFQKSIPHHQQQTTDNPEITSRHCTSHPFSS